MTDEDAKQWTLEGLIVTTPEELERAIERVLEKHGILGLAKRSSQWDRSYKGDEWWLEYRAHVVGLVKSNVAISYRDLDQDQWFRKVAGVRDRVQWLRSVDQHLVPGRPAPLSDDTHQFAAFSLVSGRDRGTRYLTFKGQLHCAIAKVAGPRRDAARLSRERYRATIPCDLCRHTMTVSVSQGPSHETDGLTDEDRAVLAARPVSSSSGGRP